MLVLHPLSFSATCEEEIKEKVVLSFSPSRSIRQRYQLCMLLHKRGRREKTNRKTRCLVYSSGRRTVRKRNECGCDTLFYPSYSMKSKGKRLKKDRISNTRL